MWTLLGHGEGHSFVVSLFRYYKKVMNRRAPSPPAAGPTMCWRVDALLQAPSDDRVA
jgi:hypothetical protein